MDLDRLDSERGGRFRFSLDGLTSELPSPLDLSWAVVAGLTGRVGDFAIIVPLVDEIPAWQVYALQEAWVAHYGLTDGTETQRLLYYLRRYAKAIEADLMRLPGCPPLTELWQTRQWRRLLNAIDHLPSNSWFADAVAGDEEHAEMLVEMEERQQAKPAFTMPFTSWSPEVSVLADIKDEIQALRLAFIGANSKSAPPKFQPYPRPVPATARIRMRMRLKRHRALADQLLGRTQGEA